MELVTRPSGIQRNSIQEVFPEHLIHSLPTYVLGVGCMPEADKAAGGTVMNKADLIPALLEPTGGRGGWRLKGPTK